MGLFQKTAIGAIFLDACTAQTHQSSATVTEHKVESGATISDHILKNPDVVTLDCFVTNTPIETPLSQADGAFLVPIPLASIGFRSPPQPFLVQGFIIQFDRVQAVYDEIQRIMNERETVEVVTSLRTYEDMAIEEVSTPRGPETGDSLRFTITLKQVQFATVTDVDVPATDLDAGKPAQATKKKPKKRRASADANTQKVSTLRAGGTALLGG